MHGASDPDPTPPEVPKPEVRRRIYPHKSLTLQSAQEERRFAFSELASAPLIVDAIYERGSKGNVADDPLYKLIPRCGNIGGFRVVGSQSFGKCKLLILKSSGVHPDWPDRLEVDTGIFTYYGDNRKPGTEMHNTPKGGNRLLSHIFAATTVVHERQKTPPILVFTNTEDKHDVRFRGLAVPSHDPEDGLVAVWRQTDGKRFQNYRARFEILKCQQIPREWISALSSGDTKQATALAPAVWKKWITSGARDILRAPKTVQHRSKEQQLPSASDTKSVKLLAALRSCFAHNPHDFEFVAAEIFRMIEPRVFDLEITKMSVDGGRDAIGRIRIGGDESDSDGIYVDFALEAKAYSESTGVGVKDTSRLISRLRHRQFGVIVTTSYVGAQAYKEIREDAHPVVIIAASDIARILRSRGLTTKAEVQKWVDGVLAVGTIRSP